MNVTRSFHFACMARREGEGVGVHTCVHCHYVSVLQAMPSCGG